LTKIEVGKQIVGKLSPASIAPISPEMPLYCIALGTGIAPVRAAIQERII